jgi:hypothetical protein
MTTIAGRVDTEQAAEAAGRIGLASKGVVYCLLATLAVAVAAGRAGPGDEVDQRGALQEVAERPLGNVALLVLSVGFAGFAAWRLYRAVHGEAGKDANAGSRVLDVGRAAIYIGFMWTALHLALGEGSQGGDAKQAFTARLMTEQSWGRAAVFVVGLVVIGVGCWQAWRGITRKFRKRITKAVGNEHRAAVAVGVVGHVARGLVIAVAGALLVREAVRFDPNQPVGLDAALREVANRAYGPYLLVAVALGLLAYGLYSFAEAKFRQVS